MNLILINGREIDDAVEHVGIIALMRAEGIAEDSGVKQKDKASAVYAISCEILDRVKKGIEAAAKEANVKAVEIMHQKARLN